MVKTNISVTSARPKEQEGKKDILQLWIASVVKPTELFRNENGKGNVEITTFNISLASVIGAVGSLVLFQDSGTLMFLGFDIVRFILSTISSIIAIVFIGGVFFLFAKLLGGKTTFINQLYVTTLFSVPISFINIVFLFMPIIGGIINFLVMIYAAYLLTLAMRETHSISTLRAIASWLVPVIFLSVVWIGIIYLFYGTLVPPQ